MKAYKRKCYAPPVTEKEKERMRELYNNGKGLDIKAIAEIVGRTHYTVYKVCNNWQPPKERVMEDTTGIFQYTEKHFESLFINFSI